MSEWREKYTKMREITERIRAMRHARAVAMLRSVGMSYDGCCIHNCSISTVGDGGWGGSRNQTREEAEESRRRISVCRAVKELESRDDGYSLVQQWDRRVRNTVHN